MCWSKFLTCAVLAGALIGALPAHAIMVTFEEGDDGEVINNQYAGITFMFSVGLSQFPWLYCDVTSGHYNAISWPSRSSWNYGTYWMNDSVSAYTTTLGSGGIVTFNASDATYVQINYCSFLEFYLEAYDEDGVQIDVDIGPANTRIPYGNESGPGTLRVDAPPGQTIAYVIVHDWDNGWTVDNLVTDAGGVAAPYNLQILSFSDADADGFYDGGERFLAGTGFLLEGPGGYSQTVTTGPSGDVSLFGLEPGFYTITELATTDARGVAVASSPFVIEVRDGETAVAMFGVVPEPAGAVLVALGGVALIWRRTKRR